MKLNPTDLARVKQTRAAFVTDPDSVAAVFYAKLFEVDPATRDMFPSHLQDQGRKLMATLAVAIDALENWDRLAPILASLARRHLSYGVEAHHYASVAQAFHATLEAAGVDSDTRASWHRAMSALTGYMIEVAYPDRERSLTGAA